MKNYLLIICVVVTITLSGCMSMYDMSNTLGTKYKYSFALVLDNDTVVPMKFVDNMIDALFTIGEEQINFELRNKTNQLLKIEWDQVLIIQAGESKRVMHKGVKYTEKKTIYNR